MQISIIGLDIAKHVFQVHAVDADEGARSRRFDCAARRCSTISPRCRRVWLAWRHARLRIIGRVS